MAAVTFLPVNSILLNTPYHCLMHDAWWMMLNILYTMDDGYLMMHDARCMLHDRWCMIQDASVYWTIYDSWCILDDGWCMIHDELCRCRMIDYVWSMKGDIYWITGWQDGWQRRMTDEESWIANDAGLYFIEIFFLILTLMVIISLKLKRVNSDQNIFF